MRPPDLDAGLCRKFAPKELERTFFYPGPQDVARTPTAFAQQAWNQAKEVCIECPVFLLCRKTCLGAEYGVMGGMDEHERHLQRRRLARELAVKSADERAQLAEHFHARHAGGLGDPVAAMARSTGYSEQAIKALIAEHQKVLDEREAPTVRRVYGAMNEDEIARVRRLAEGGASLRYIATVMGRGITVIERLLAEMNLEDKVSPQWPRQRPPGDAWVWHDGMVRNAWYLGETEDGSFFMMQIRVNGSATKRWFPKSFVDMRSSLTRTVLEWRGRSDEQKTA